MTQTVRFKTQRRRRRVGSTNYHKRLGLLKSEDPRLVVRISHNKTSIQLIKSGKNGDETLVNTTSLELKKYGWNGSTGNCPAAYLTGFLAGQKCKQKNIVKAVLDIGLHTPVKGSNVFSALKGAVDAGMLIPHEEKIMPPKERIEGKIISDYKKGSLNFSDTKNKISAGLVKKQARAS